MPHTWRGYTMRILAIAVAVSMLWSSPVAGQIQILEGNTLPGPNVNPHAVESWQGVLYYATSRDDVTHYGLSAAPLPDYPFGTVLEIRDCGSELLILASETIDTEYFPYYLNLLYAFRWDGTTLTKTRSYYDTEADIDTAGPGIIYQGAIFTGGIGIKSLRGTRLRYYDGVEWQTVSVDDDIRALEIIDGDLYAVGEFTSIEGVAAPSVARFDGATWTAFGSGLPATAETIAWTGSEYYATTRSELWKRQAHSDTWIKVADAGGGFITDAIAWNGDLVLVGSFTSMDGAPAEFVARFDGSLFHELPGGPNDPIDSVSLHGSGFVVEGGFLGVASEPANYTAVFDGSSWHPARPGGLGVVCCPSTLSTYEGDLLISSNNSSLEAPSTTAAHGVARFTPSGWQGLGGGLHGGEVNELLDHDGVLYVQGDFEHTGGVQSWPNVPLPGWATWDGNQWASWTPPPTGSFGETYYLGIQGDDVIVGGSAWDFGQYELMARWDGSTWSSFPSGSPLTGGYVTDVVEFDGKLFVTGTTIREPLLPGDHYSLYWDGAQWNETNLSYYQSRFVEWNGDLYVTGRYTSRWDTDHWTNAWQLGMDLGERLLTAGGKLYKYSWDQDADGDYFGQLLRWFDGTGWVQILEVLMVDTLGNVSSGSIRDIIEIDQTTYVVGGFTHLNGVRSDNFGAFTGEIAVAVDPQTPSRKLAIEAFPNPANPRVSFTLEYGRGGPVWLDIYDVRGRQVRTLIAGRQLVEGSPVVWDGRSDSGELAASGVYFARARYGGEAATVKFALVK
jgi:hypothetical protein